jgi:arsenate reductase
MSGSKSPARPYNVLFLCTGNSARSIIAEAMLNKIGKPRFWAFSAGSKPSGRVNPHAAALLGWLGFDIADARSKSWTEFLTPGAPVLDFVITVCDAVAGETCPVWPGHPLTAHWSVPNPAAVQGTLEDIAHAFREAFDLLERRIALLADLPIESLDRMSLKRRLDEIGKASETV